MTDETPSAGVLATVTDGRRRPIWRSGFSVLWKQAWPVAALLVVLWIVFTGQTLADWTGRGEPVLVYGALYPPAVRAGVWWTLLTHMFLHGGILHIALNASALGAFGPAVSQRLGRDAVGALLFLAFFILCGLAGGALYLALHWNGQMPMLGASGAICGLWGAMARMTETTDLAPVWSRPVGLQARSFLVMNLILVGIGGALGLISGVGGVLVAWEAHVGGFVTGLFLVSLFPARFWWLSEAQASR